MWISLVLYNTTQLVINTTMYQNNSDSKALLRIFLFNFFHFCFDSVSLIWLQCFFFSTSPYHSESDSLLFKEFPQLSAPIFVNWCGNELNFRNALFALQPIDLTSCVQCIIIHIHPWHDSPLNLHTTFVITKHELR